MQDRYNFPAVFHYNPDGRIGIYFPDLPGCVSQAISDCPAYPISILDQAKER